MDSLIALVKSLAMAATMATFGIYHGAVFIAIFAALSRLAYTHEKSSLKLFGRFFVMSLSLTMMLVHVGQISGWSSDIVIVVSGVVAFLCREVLESIVASKDLIIKKIVGVMK